MPASSLISLASAVLKVPPPERALVVGCGDGEPVLLLAREFPAARVRGLDPSTELVGAATSRVGLDPEGRVAFKAGKATALPYPDEFFDLAVHLAGRATPAELARVLRPGGHLILVIGHRRRFAIRARESLILRRLGRHGFRMAPPEAAGNGNFYVGRLGQPGRPAPSI